MKDRKRKLALNKQTVINLTSESMKNAAGGGHTAGSFNTCTEYQLFTDFTEGECFDTLGDDNCWTPFKYLGW